MNAPRRVAWLALTIALAACSTSAAPVAVAPTTAAPAAATPSPIPAPTVAPTATPVPPPDWSAVPIPAADPAGLGAQGPMQFIPQTWAAYGQGDVNSPHDAIVAAARYLKAAGAPGDMSRAIFAYNHSLGYVNAVIAYAEVMKADQAALRGYYGWQVYFPTADGVILMPVGWKKS